MKLDFLYPAWLILCISTGALLGHTTGYGAFKGATDGVLVAAAPFLLLLLALLLWSRWRPILPVCRCGKCNHKRYRLAAAPDFTATVRKTRWNCPECGRCYESSDGRFYEILEGGGIAPYLHHTRWGRWQGDTRGPRPDHDG